MVVVVVVVVLFAAEREITRFVEMACPHKPWDFTSRYCRRAIAVAVAVAVAQVGSKLDQVGGK